MFIFPAEDYMYNSIDHWNVIGALVFINHLTVRDAFRDVNLFSGS